LNLFDTYQPQDPFEVADLDYIRDAIKHYGDALYQRHPHMHYSASAMIFNQTMTKTVMIYHKLYDSWGWVGGHMDGMTDFKMVAIKEATEETGLSDLKLLSDKPISIEVLPVWFHMKKGAAISSHLHLNVSYILIANEDEPLLANDIETDGVRWIDLKDIDQFVSEPEMMPIYTKIIERGKNHEKHNSI
jgi:8-oxo-dGTP pyrophosphatase MutT (NUDIX family)